MFVLIEKELLFEFIYSQINFRLQRFVFLNITTEDSLIFVASLGTISEKYLLKFSAISSTSVTCLFDWIFSVIWTL